MLGAWRYQPGITVWHLLDTRSGCFRALYTFRVVPVPARLGIGIATRLRLMQGMHHARLALAFTEFTTFFRSVIASIHPLE